MQKDNQLLQKSLGKYEERTKTIILNEEGKEKLIVQLEEANNKVMIISWSCFHGWWNIYILTLQAPIPQNGQTHSNNSSAICRQIVWVCLTILWKVKEISVIAVLFLVYFIVYIIIYWLVISWWSPLYDKKIGKQKLEDSKFLWINRRSSRTDNSK